MAAPTSGSRKTLIMKNEKTPSSNPKMKASKSKPQRRKCPPDPDGYFKEIAARAKKVIALYAELNPGAEHHELVWFLLLDLKSLCDREPALGDFEDAYMHAHSIYGDLVEESEFMVS